MYHVTDTPPDWTKWVLRSAGTYHLAAAGAALWSPEGLFHYLAPGEPFPGGMAMEFLASAALLTAVLGAGFWFAARNAFRHWPVVLMGLLAHLAIGGGLAFEIVRHRVDGAAWLLVILGSLIWALAFVAVLRGAHEALLRMRRAISPEVLKFAMRRKTQYGITLDEHTRLSPVLLVFLRQSGCMFCRETLSDLAQMQAAIEGQGARVVLVHMGHEAHAQSFFEQYGLENVPRISDPERALYRAFALCRGSLIDLFGPKVWWRAFEAAVLRRHGLGRLIGDGFQMPGAFLLFHGEIVRCYRHQSAADRPDYVALVSGRDYAAPELRDI